MLYDPTWEQETKADPLTLESLIAWLEKQPAWKPYCYSDTGRCLAAQYNRHIGRKYHVASVPGNGSPPKSAGFDVKLEWIAVQEPYTFGAALRRARKLAGGE